MDTDLLTIFGFVLLVCMIVFPFALVVHRRSVEHEERKLELITRAEEAKRGGGSEAYRKLEERVRVLERIATDKDDDLAREIEALRDIQEIDQLTDKREAAQ